MSAYSPFLNWFGQHQCLNKSINKDLKSWLFDTGSLTARLLKHCPGRFSVQLISLERTTPDLDEASALNLKPRSQAMIREVILCCDKQPVIYARTIIPVSSMRGALRGLATLGNQPLGAVLFADKSMKRKPVQVSSISPAHKYYSRIGNKGNEKIFGRRSVFVLKGQELLVSEFFLPGLLTQNNS